LSHHRRVTHHQAACRRGTPRPHPRRRAEPRVFSWPKGGPARRGSAGRPPSLLRRSIISQSPEGPQQRQTARRNHLHYHMAVFAVAIEILRAYTRARYWFRNFHADFRPATSGSSFKLSHFILAGPPVLFRRWWPTAPGPATLLRASRARRGLSS